MEKVIVTGASGFIGKALTKKLLDEGKIVYAVVRNPEKIRDLENKNLYVINLNLNEYQKLPELIIDEIDVFYHFAWEGTFGESFRNYYQQFDNVKYSGDAITAACNMKCKKFILAGTIVELEVKKYINMNYCEPRISCIYGTAKMAAEMLCKIIAYNNNIEFNMSIIASVYGVGDYSLMIQNILINAFNKGNTIKLVKGENLYDWIYIDDVVNAFISIGEKGVNFKTYYVGHRELKTFKEIVTQVRDIINPDIELKFGELNDSTPLDYSLININELYEDTGFEAKVDFKESILKTSEWVKTLNI
jgi:nucleoside-diphosphate-sugar epimerase